MKSSILEDLLFNHIEIGSILYFTDAQISSSEPHYFICIFRDNDSALFLVCTTDRHDYIKKQVTLNKTENALIWMNNPSPKGLPKECYCYCINTFRWTKNQLIEKFKLKIFKIQENKISNVKLVELIEAVLDYAQLNQKEKYFLQNSLSS